MISGNDNYLLVFPWEFSLYMGLLSHSLRPQGPFPSAMTELTTERNAYILGYVGMCGYTYIHPHMETVGSLQCCSSVIIHIFVSAGNSPSRLLSQQTPRIFLCPTAQCWDLKDLSQHTILKEDSRNWTQVLVLERSLTNLRLTSQSINMLYLIFLCSITINF